MLLKQIFWPPLSRASPEREALPCVLCISAPHILQNHGLQLLKFPIHIDLGIGAVFGFRLPIRAEDVVDAQQSGDLPGGELVGDGGGELVTYIMAGQRLF